MVPSRRTLILLGLATQGCSLLVPSQDAQCQQDSDCADRGFADSVCVDNLCVAGAGGQAPSGPWGCKDSVVWVDEDLSTAASITMHVVKLIGQEPFEGLTLYACPPYDTTCADPLTEGTTNAEGDTTLEVNVGFRGHFFAPPPPTFADMAPLLSYFFPPPTANNPNQVEGNLTLTSLSQMGIIAATAGKQVEPGTGHLFYTAFDCENNRATGISVKSDIVSTSTTAVYISESGVPSATLPATTERGEGALINLPPGFVTITATSDEAGKVFEQTVLIAADSITGIPILPSP